MRKIFNIAFIVSCFALIAFLIVHLKNTFRILEIANDISINPQPELALQYLFTPTWIVLLIITILSTLTFQVAGFIMTIRNKQLGEGERIAFAIGFILANFITAIIFLIMKKGKQYEESIK